MNVRDFEYVLALGTTGQFAKAARRCRVSQPTLSTQVAKLEAELGVRLFERGPGGVSPTPAGQRVIARARTVLDAIDALKAEAHGQGQRWVGPLRLGAIPTAGPYLMPHVLPVLRKSQPEAQWLIREGQTHDLLERLTASDLDAAIVSPPLNAGNISTAAIFEEPFVFAAPAGHPMAKRTPVRLADLSDTPMLLLEEGHCLRSQTLDVCSAAPQRDEPFQASSLESLRHMVMAGIGVTLLPRLATVGPYAQLTRFPIRRFVKPEPTRTLVLAWRRSFPRGELLRGMANDMGDALRAVLKRNNAKKKT